MSKSIKPFNAKVVLIYVFYFHTIRCFPAIRKYFLDNCSHRNAASCFQYSFSLGTPTFSIYGSPRACLQAAASNQTYLERSIPVNLPRTQIGIQTRDLICSEDQTCQLFLTIQHRTAPREVGNPFGYKRNRGYLYYPCQMIICITPPPLPCWWPCLNLRTLPTEAAGDRAVH